MTLEYFYFGKNSNFINLNIEVEFFKKSTSNKINLIIITKIKNIVLISYKLILYYLLKNSISILFIIKLLLNK